MKKTYINPQMEVISIEVQQMLAASSIGIEGSTDTVQSRGFGDDDDDWE